MHMPLPKYHASAQIFSDISTDRRVSWAGLERSLYLECGDGEIISVLGICNGKNDCFTGKDEEDCPNSGTYI